MPHSSARRQALFLLFLSAARPFHLPVKNDLFLNTKALGVALRETREYLDLSLRELARASGVSHSQIRRIEGGEFDCFTSSFIRLCGAMGIRFSELLERCIDLDMEVYSTAIKAELQVTLRNQPDLDAISIKATQDLVLGACGIMVFLLRSATPDEMVKEFDFPSESLQQRFAEIAERIKGQGFDLANRMKLITLLQAKPVSTLRNFFKYPSNDDVQHHIRVFPAREFSAFYPWTPKLHPVSMSDLKDFEDLLRERHPEEAKKRLHETSEISKLSGDMKSAMDELLGKIRKLTAVRGRKSELAAFLGVSPARITEWLKGDYEPSGKTTLKMLEWVELLEK